MNLKKGRARWIAKPNYRESFISKKIKQMIKLKETKENPITKNVREWIQLGIIIFTALLSAYGFFIKDIWSPTHESSCLNVNARLTNEGKKGQLTLIHTYISTHNPTKKRIEVPALWYTVIGYTIKESLPVSANYQKKSLDSIFSDELVCNYVQYDSVIVAQQRIISDKNSWWKPGDKTNNDFIIAVPSGKFDFVSLHVHYLSTRYIADVDSIIWSADNSGQWIAYYTFKPDVDKSDTWLTYLGYIPENWRTKFGYSWYKTSLKLSDK
jgi:hypothetical protein